MLTEIEKLDALGRECGCVIYSIHQAAAGWGCQWYEHADKPLPADWNRGIHVYNYYPTITEMIEAEKVRLANYSAGLLEK